MSFTTEAKEEVINRLEICGKFPDKIQEELSDLFLSMLFLQYGYVSDPKKSYRLELVIDTKIDEVNEQAAQLLINMCKETPGFLTHTKRKDKDIFYTTRNEDIFDFLTVIGANNAAVAYTDAFIEKNLSNRYNRTVNCDMANIDKLSNAAQEQIKHIKKIEKSCGLESLPEKLREVALLRLQNPDIPLSELGELCNPKLSRSGVNHRIQKLIEISKNL
jgi:DNA-binding protein WhiA